jgi:hypothetical protein
VVAAALVISRSSLYYRKKPRGSRADRRWDERIVQACGEKPAYGYRRVTWWLRRKEGLCVNRKRVLRVMREEVYWFARDACEHDERKSGAEWKQHSRIRSGNPT